MYFHVKHLHAYFLQNNTIYNYLTLRMKVKIPKIIFFMCRDSLFEDVYCFGKFQYIRNVF